MTKNRKFEQIEQITIIQNKKKTFFVNINHNTSRRNFFRICRFIYFVDSQINFIFHFTHTRSTFNINIFKDIFHIYQQLFHVRFFNIFVQFALIEIIKKFERSELNELKWQYQSFFSSENFSKEKDFIFIFNNLNFCQLFDLRIRTRLSLFNNSFFQNSNSIISTSNVKFEV